MKIQIDIECDTANEFMQHLDKIQKDCKKKLKKLEVNPLKSDLPPGIDLSDDNCYGWHTVEVSY